MNPIDFVPPIGEISDNSPILDSVTEISLPNKIVWLVGTAHVSRSSVDEVEKVIREKIPDLVIVELDEARLKTLEDPERWKQMNLGEVIWKGKTFVLLAQLVLSSYQKRIGNMLHVKPGEEMLKAVTVGREVGAKVILGDRDIRITLLRTWNLLGLKEMGRIFWAGFLSIFQKESVDIQEIERLKEAHVLEAALAELEEFLPAARITLIDERDRYLAENIRTADGQRIVAVVGAGHVKGISRYVHTPQDLEKLKIIPPARLWVRAIGVLIPLTFVAMIISGFMSDGFGKILEMATEWAIVTGFTAAVGAAIALAHPLTVIAAAISAPITTLHPFLGSGMVCGAIEVMIRKPRVIDFENAAEDIQTFKGFFYNRILRALLVVISTSLVGTLGMVFALRMVAMRL